VGGFPIAGIEVVMYSILATFLYAPSKYILPVNLVIAPDAETSVGEDIVPLFTNVLIGTLPLLPRYNCNGAELASVKYNLTRPKSSAVLTSKLPVGELDLIPNLTLVESKNKLFVPEMVFVAEAKAT
jgi:hypothetical protein